MFGISSLANGVVTPPLFCNAGNFPGMHHRIRNDPTSTSFRELQLSQSKSLGFCFRLSDGLKEKSWVARVGAPLSDATFHEDGDEVDPKHCWVKNTWKSIIYVLRDVAVVAGLVYLAVKYDCWTVWLFYWCAQSIMFLDLSVLGQETFHAWRTKHQKIQNHGCVENDDLLNGKTSTSFDKVNEILRFFFPFHLWSSSPGKMGSDYDLPNIRKDVLASTACCIAMLFALSFVIGPIKIFKLFGVPYLVTSNLQDTDALPYVHPYPFLIVTFVSLNLHSNAGVCGEPGLGELLASPYMDIMTLALMSYIPSNLTLQRNRSNSGQQSL